MPDLAVIGSQDVESHEWLDDTRKIEIRLDDQSVSATIGHLNGCELIVLPRNGVNRPMPPHAIDYKSNIQALVASGVRRVMTTSMVGTLRRSIPVDSLLLLDQFIDFTKNRQFTYFTDDRFGFADMTEPFCPALRGRTLAAAEKAGIEIAPHACYLCVPGPRFETRAEVQMFAQWGADVIGHTTVTDCVMAREAGLCFTTVAGVITLGAGLSDHAMDAGQWHEARRRHARRFRSLVGEVARALAENAEPDDCRCSVAAPIEN
jgi:5'-methylthioadenosine phosphorylase